jgi:GNAT superfamily N-acetyltransferase
MLGKAGSVRVRPARPEDASRIVDLDRELAGFEGLAGPDRNEGERLKRWIFEEKRFRALVAEDGQGRVIGMALYYMIPTSFRARPALYLEDILVTDSARSSGAGRALMAGLAREAEAAGCVRMEWAVLPWNERAIGFYRRLGARPQEEWVRYMLEEPEIRKLARKARP